jgi:hypothetical protein
VTIFDECHHQALSEVVNVPAGIYRNGYPQLFCIFCENKRYEFDGHVLSAFMKNFAA